MNTYAFVPFADRPANVDYIDLSFIPSDSDDWSSGQAGSGIVRLFCDGSIALIENIVSEDLPYFYFTIEDFKIIQSYISEI